MTWVYIVAAAGAAVFLAMLAGPILFGRLFMPRLTLPLVRRFGRLSARLLDRIKPGLDLQLLVKAGNKYFAEDYKKIPFQERVLFLPYCLRPKDCPAEIDWERGLLCRDDCLDCRLGQVRREALALGYREVFIVPSSRLLPKENLRRSDQFIKDKLKELSPRAAMGVVCDWNLRTRLIGRHKVGRKGMVFGADGSSSCLQGVLLDRRNCVNATVDWAEVEEKMRLAESPPDCPADQ